MTPTILETMKQALDALEKSTADNPKEALMQSKAIRALRAAIEQYEAAEPVGWLGKGPRDGRAEFCVSKPSPSVFRDFNMQPVFTNPAPAVPSQEPKL